MSLQALRGQSSRSLGHSELAHSGSADDDDVFFDALQDVPGASMDEAAAEPPAAGDAAASGAIRAPRFSDAPDDGAAALPLAQRSRGLGGVLLERPSISRSRPAPGVAPYCFLLSGFGGFLQMRPRPSFVLCAARAPPVVAWCVVNDMQLESLLIAAN
jgi:hypothetical protein